MREIAAASDFDFVASEPAPVRKARGPGKARARSASNAQSWLSRLWTWRTPMFGGLAFILLLAAIGVNAMFLQNGRHPAPLMGSVLRIEPPKVEPAPAPAAVAKVEPAKPAPAAIEEALAPMPLARTPAPAPIKAKTLAAPSPAPAPAPAAKPVLAKPLPAAPAAKPQPVQAQPVQLQAAKPAPAVKPAPAAKIQAKPADPIAALMDKSTPALPAKSVTDAQKALNKLGAHVPANGKYDAATRKAVEKFQRDNGLPVTGELTPNLRRFLALQAGAPGG